MLEGWEFLPSAVVELISSLSFEILHISSHSTLLKQLLHLTCECVVSLHIYLLFSHVILLC